MAEPPEDVWSAMLAGQDVPDAPEDVKREVRLLRQALAERNAEIDRMDIPAEAVESALATMLNQAKAKGLLETETAPGASVLLPSNTGWLVRLTKFFGLDEGQGFMPALAIAATLVLGVGVALVMTPEQKPPYELERGGSKPGPEADQPREVADPAKEARTLADELKNLGLAVSVSEDLGIWFVEADIQSANPVALRALLDKEGIAQPANGHLRVMFAQKH